MKNLIVIIIIISLLVIEVNIAEAKVDFNLFDYDLFKEQLRQIGNFLFRPVEYIIAFLKRDLTLKQHQDLGESSDAPMVTEVTEQLAEIIPKFNQVLEPGMQNNEVRELQKFLSQFKDIYPEGVVNGYYGPSTEAAVIRCQQKFGLSVDGKIGPKTIAALNDLWQATQASNVKNLASSDDVLRTASVFDVPLPQELHCLGSNKEESPKDPLYEREECFKYYNPKKPDEPACPKYFNPVHDANGVMYPTACWAEKFGARNYKYGLGGKMEQFMNDLWYTPKEKAKSYLVPKPNVEFSYGFGPSGLMSEKKGGVYLRSTLWPSDNVFFVLDYNIDTNRGTQFSTNYNPGFTVLKSGGTKKALLIFSAFEEEFRYPENVVVEWTQLFEKPFNEYLKSVSQLKDPMQLEFTSVVIDPPTNIRRDDLTYIDPETGEKRRSILVGGSGPLSAGEKEAYYSSATAKIGRKDFDIVVVVTDNGLNSGDGTYDGVYNDMEFMIAGLTPPEPYTDKELLGWLKSMGAFQTIFRVISHELFHARGWSADHFPHYETAQFMDIKSGSVSQEGNLCDAIGQSDDFLPFKLPSSFQLQVGEEPAIWEFGKTFTFTQDSSSGRCFGVVHSPGRTPKHMITLKDYDRDGIYEGIYGRPEWEEHTVIHEGLQRTMGWADIDGDGIAELNDPDRYGGYEDHIGYKPYKSKQLIGPAIFEPLSEISIEGCRFEKIRLDNGEEGIVPLQCLELNQDIVNLYKNVRYKWLKVKKDYGTILLARLPSTSEPEVFVFEKDRPCAGQKIYTSLEDALKKPQDVCVLDLRLRLLPKKIKILPSFIGKFTNLKELYLDDNFLNKIPSDIGKLSRLEILDLCTNWLSELPREIGNLSNLRVLRLCDSGIGQLPEELYNLTKLETLELRRLNAYEKESGASIAKSFVISPNIGKLTNLKKLNLRDNQSLKLPPEISLLQNLKILNLGYNNFEELPGVISQLKNLRWLDIHIKDGKISEEEKNKIRKLLPGVRISF